MPRPAAKVKKDDVARAVRAAMDCGLTVMRIDFVGETFRVITHRDACELTESGDPDSFGSFDDYQRWRDANTDQGHPSGKA